MNSWSFLVLWMALLAALVGAFPTNNSNTISFSNNTVATTDVSTKPFIWSCLGDSWASGVSYGIAGTTDYDGNKDHCMRVRHAYSAQMYTDPDWVPDGRTQAFYFQACSGTHWQHIDREYWQDHIQLNDVQPNTDMILLQAGGNNAGFATVAYACIFAPYGQDYGGHYPDPSGECYKAIERSSAYIHSREEYGLFQDARDIVNKAFQHPHTRSNPDFRLFVAGYWEFFYDKGGDGDWCDDVSFALNYENRPTLTLALRKKINELVHALNEAIREGVEGSFYPERAEFIYTDHEMYNTKFCMPGHTIWDQYCGEKVQLWNMSPEGVVTIAGGNNGADDSNGTYEVRDPTPEEFDYWRETGRFTDDPREVPMDMSQIAAAALGQAGAAMGDLPKWLDQTGPFQQGFPGLTLRPFHPKFEGHSGIARGVMSRVQNHYKTKPIQNKFSVQIIFCKQKSTFSWYVYQGPQGEKANPTPSNDKIDNFVRINWDKQESRPGLSIDDPPYVGEGVKWPINIPGRDDCRFEAEANGPRSLKCSDGYEKKFKMDGSWNDGAFKVEGTYSRWKQIAQNKT